MRQSFEDTIRELDGTNSDDRWFFRNTAEKTKKSPINFSNLLPKKKRETSGRNNEAPKQDDLEADTSEEEALDLDSGEQESELDHQTATLEYKLLYYKIDAKTKKEMLDSLPEKNRERVRFVEQYIDILNTCPSSGRALTRKEAFDIYEDYQAHIADMAPEDRPMSKIGVLCEIEDMLEEKKKTALESGNTELADSYGYKLMMISDQETLANVKEYYALCNDSRTSGSYFEMVSYIKNKIEQEGYSGTLEMRNHKPPILGGALRIERNLKLMDMLNEDVEGGSDSNARRKSLLKIMQSKEAGGGLSREDWRFLEQFSERGKELHNYVNALDRARIDRKNRDEYEDSYKQRMEIAGLLRERTPTEDLPDQIIEMLLKERPNEAQIAERFYAMEASHRARVKILRGDGELPPAIQKRLERTGLSREEYADQLEAEADEMRKKGDAADRGEFTDEQREIMKKLMITRKELAERHENTGLALHESALKANREYQAIKHALERTPDDYMNEVLCVNREGAPEIPQDVREYVYRNYGNSISALAVTSPDYGKSTFPVSRLARLCKLIKKSQEKLDKSANWHDRAYGDEAHFDFDSSVYIQGETNYYREESTFIGEKVLPALEAMVKFLGGTLPYEDEPETAVDDSASQDPELAAA